MKWRRKWLEPTISAICIKTHMAFSLIASTLKNLGDITLFKFLALASALALSTCAAQPAFAESPPPQRDNEAIAWIANQFDRAQEAIRLTEELEAFDEKEIACLATNMYHEARSESIDGQVAVAWVTINRRDADAFRDTICGVVWQTTQFSWTHDGKSDYPANRELYEIDVSIARDMYYNYQRFTDPTDGSTYYHANYVSPYWKDRFEQVVAIDNHIFYKG